MLNHWSYYKLLKYDIQRNISEKFFSAVKSIKCHTSRAQHWQMNLISYLTVESLKLRWKYMNGYTWW